MNGVSKSLVAALLVAGLASCSMVSNILSAAKGSNDTEDMIQEGQLNFEKGRYGIALSEFRAALEFAEENDQRIRALNGIGASADMLGRYKEADTVYARALALDPLNPQTLNNIGYSYLMRGKYDLAIAFLRDADPAEPGEAAITAHNFQAAVLRYREGRSTDRDQAAIRHSVEQQALAGETLQLAQLADDEGAEAGAPEQIIATLLHQEVVSRNPDTVWLERMTQRVQLLVTPGPESATRPERYGRFRFPAAVQQAIEGRQAVPSEDMAELEAAEALFAGEAALSAAMPVPSANLDRNRNAANRAVQGTLEHAADQTLPAKPTAATPADRIVTPQSKPTALLEPAQPRMTWRSALLSNEPGLSASEELLKRHRTVAGDGTGSTWGRSVAAWAGRLSEQQPAGEWIAAREVKLEKDFLGSALQ
jgi:Flp pilus assembly protein TadD